MPAIMPGVLARCCLVATVVLGSAPTTAAAQDREAAVIVLASNGVKAVLEHLSAESARLIGRPISLNFDTSAALRRRIEAGAAFDLTVMTTDAVEALDAAGLVVPGSIVHLGRSSIGLAVRAGSARPDISSPAALRQALLDAPSLTYAADGATRSDIERMLAALEIAEQTQGKTTLEQGSVAATARVARGESVLVITLVSEILPVAGIDLVGPLPAQFQRYLSFAAGVGARASQADAAGRIVTFLAGPEAEPAFAARGLER